MTPDDPQRRPSALARARRLVSRPPDAEPPAPTDAEPPAATDPSATAAAVPSVGEDDDTSTRRPRPGQQLPLVTAPGGRGLAGRRPSPAKGSTTPAGLGTAEPVAAEPATDEPVTDGPVTAESVTDGPDTGGPGEAPKKSRAGRNLPAAIGVGLGLGAVIVATLFLYRLSFAVIVGLAALYGVFELGQALKAARIRVSLGPLLVGTVAMLVAAWERGTDGLIVAGLITVVAVLVWRIADGAHAYTRDAVASVFAVLYVPLLAGFAIMLAHPHDGAGRELVFIATVVCSDTGGYATGVLFGKHPLAPVVSKAKTWEGFTGSVVACGTAGVLFFTLTFHQEWWKGLLYGLAIVVTATLGDLGESLVKRDLDIKDMGRLLPGHGGVMDRLDSLLPCAAVAYLLLTHLAPV